MKEMDTPLGPHREIMDVPQPLVPFLRDLLEQITEMKDEIKSCNAELQLISQKLKEGQIGLPKEKLALDCKCFSQSPENEDKTLFQNSTTDNNEFQEIVETSEGNTAEKKADSIQELFGNRDTRDNLVEAVEGCEQNRCNLFNEIYPQKGCCEVGTCTPEVNMAFVTANILSRKIQENIMHLERGIVSGDFVMDKDADGPARSLNYRDDGRNNIVETDLDDDKENSSQEEDKSFQRGNVIDTDVSDKDVDLDRNKITDKVREENANNKDTPVLWQSCGRWPECICNLHSQLVGLQQEDMCCGSYAEMRVESDKAPLNELNSTGFANRHMNKSCISEESVHHEATQMKTIATASADNIDRGISGELSLDKEKDLEAGEVKFGFQEDFIYQRQTPDNSAYPDQINDGTGCELKKMSCNVIKKSLLDYRKALMDTDNNSEYDPNAGPNTNKVQCAIKNTLDKTVETKQDYASKDFIPDVASKQQIIYNVQMPNESLLLKPRQMRHRETLNDDVNPENDNANFEFLPDSETNEQKRIDDDIIQNINMNSKMENENLGSHTRMDLRQESENVISTPVQHVVPQQVTQRQTYLLHEGIISVHEEIRNHNDPDKENGLEVRKINDIAIQDDSVDQGKELLSNKLPPDNSIPDLASKQQIISDSTRIPNESLFLECGEIEKIENNSNVINLEMNNAICEFPPDEEMVGQDPMGNKTIQDENLTSIMKQDNLSLGTMTDQGQELKNVMSFLVEHDVPVQHGVPQHETKSHENMYSVQAPIRKQYDAEKESGPEFIITNDDFTPGGRVDQRKVPVTDNVAQDDFISDVPSKQLIIESTHMTEENLIQEHTEIDNKETENNDVNVEINNTNTNIDFPPDNVADHQRERMNINIMEDKEVTPIRKQNYLSLDTTMGHRQEYSNEVSIAEECDVHQQEIKSHRSTYRLHETVYSAHAKTRDRSDLENENATEIRISNDSVTPDNDVNQGKVLMRDQVVIDDSIPSEGSVDHEKVLMGDQVFIDDSIPSEGSVDQEKVLMSDQVVTDDSIPSEGSVDQEKLMMSNQVVIDDSIPSEGSVDQEKVLMSDQVVTDDSIPSEGSVNQEKLMMSNQVVIDDSIPSEGSVDQEKVLMSDQVVTDDSIPSEGSVNQEKLMMSNQVVIDDSIPTEGIVDQEKVLMSDQVVTDDSIPSEGSVNQEQLMMSNQVVIDDSIPSEGSVDQEKVLMSDQVVTDDSIPSEGSVNQEKLMMSNQVVIDDSIPSEGSVDQEKVMMSDQGVIDDSIPSEGSVDQEKVLMSNQVVIEDSIPSEGSVDQEKVMMSDQDVMHDSNPSEGSVDQEKLMMSNQVVINNSIPSKGSDDQEKVMMSDQVVIDDSTPSKGSVDQEKLMMSDQVVLHDSIPPEGKVDQEKVLMSDHVVVDDSIPPNGSVDQRKVMISDQVVIDDYIPSEGSVHIEKVMMNDQVVIDDSIPSEGIVDQEKLMMSDQVVLDNSAPPNGSVKQGKVLVTDQVIVDDSILDVPCNQKIIDITQTADGILFPESRQINNRDNLYIDVTPEISKNNFDNPPDIEADEQRLMDDKIVQKGQEHTDDISTIVECDVPQKEAKSQTYYLLESGPMMKRNHDKATSVDSMDQGKVMMSNRHYNSHGEAKPSDFDDPIEIKSQVFKKEGIDNACEQTPNNEISNRETVTSSLGDKIRREQLDDDTDSLHPYPHDKQFDPEQKRRCSGSNSSFGEHCVAVDEVNIENPTGFYDNEIHHFPKTQSMDTILSKTDSHPPSQQFGSGIIAEKTCEPAIAPSCLFSSSLPLLPTTKSKGSSTDIPIEELTSSFNGMEMRQRIKTVPKMEPKTSEKTRLKTPGLLRDHSYLGSATPDNSIAFRAFIDCCRPIRADSRFNIVYDTVFSHGNAFQGGNQGSFVAPFHGLYLLRLWVDTNNRQGQELSMGMELNDYESNNQFWLCLQSITLGKRQTFLEKTVVLKPGDSVYAKIEHVRGFNLGLQSVCFEGHSLFRGVR